MKKIKKIIINKLKDYSRSVLYWIFWTQK